MILISSKINIFIILILLELINDFQIKSGKYKFVSFILNKITIIIFKIKQ